MSSAKRKVLLDTSPLLLFLVGNSDSTKVGAKRLEAYDHSDLVRLNELVGQYPYHVSTPNVLTETSNHLGDHHQFLSERGAQALANYVSQLEEIYIPTLDCLRAGHLEKLGVTDSGLIEVALKGVTIVTVDHRLHGMIESVGGKSINLMHFKTPL